MDPIVRKTVQKAMAKVRNELGLGTDGSVTDPRGEPLILIGEP